MKKLILIISIAFLAVSCKKDKLYSCLEGKWYGVGATEPTYIIDSKGYESVNDYTINSDGYVVINGSNSLKFSCSDNNLTVCTDVKFGCDANNPLTIKTYTKH